MVQWLRLRTSTEGAAGSIPGQGTKILHVAQWEQKISKKEKRKAKGVRNQVENQSYNKKMGPMWIQITSVLFHETTEPSSLSYAIFQRGLWSIGSREMLCSVFRHDSGIILEGPSCEQI